MSITGKKMACVTGGTGYVAGMLVMQLLKKVYAVNTTVRNPDDEKKVSPLRKLQENYKDIRIFKADLTHEGSFDEAIDGCHFVFLVATPIHLQSEDPETGSLSMTHLEDAVESHIFLAEKESATGRYNCCPINIGLLELAMFLKNRLPQYNVPTDFGDFPAEAKVSISSEKIIKAGFKFKYGLEDIYDQFVEYFQTIGLLKK